MATEAQTPEAELDNPFGSPEEHPLPVGASPKGTLSESRRTGRSRLGRGLATLIPGATGPANGSVDHPVTLTGDSFSTDGASSPKPKKTGDPAATAKIVVGIVGVGLALGTWALARRGRRLRKPTKEQIRDFAKPIGAMLARHTDLSWLGDDIQDISTAAAVATDYASEGPIAPKVARVEQVGMESVPGEPEPTTVPPTTDSFPTIPAEPTGPVTYLQ